MCFNRRLFYSTPNISYAIHTRMQSLAKSKQLIRNTDIEELLKVNEEECELLEERWLSDECMKAIMAFMERKK